MLIDNFFSRVRSLTSTTFQYLVAKKRNERVIGLKAEIVLDEIMSEFPYTVIGRNKELVYCSLSRQPQYDLFDEYGIPDDDVFHYFSDIKSILRQCVSTGDNGWRIYSCKLVSAKEDLLDV